MNLLVATFGTLFRSSLPLLLNLDDSFNKDLLGNDEELLAPSKRLKGIMLWFRANAFRNSIGNQCHIRRNRQGM